MVDQSINKQSTYKKNQWHATFGEVRERAREREREGGRWRMVAARRTERAVAAAALQRGPIARARVEQVDVAQRVFGVAQPARCAVRRTPAHTPRGVAHPPNATYWPSGSCAPASKKRATRGPPTARRVHATPVTPTSAVARTRRRSPAALSSHSHSTTGLSTRSHIIRRLFRCFFVMLCVGGGPFQIQFVAFFAASRARLRAK